MPNGHPQTRAAQDWLASLPRDRDFSLEHAYQRFLDDHPRQALSRRGCSDVIVRSGKFERYKDGPAVMFRYRGVKM